MCIDTVVLHRTNKSRTGGHTINAYTWVTDHVTSLVDGKYHLSNYLHKGCAWYVYSIFLQQELDTVKVEWNNHYIRKLKNSQISEIPDKLFSTQQLHGYGNLFKETSLEEIDTLFQEYEIRNQKNIASDAKEILNDHDSTLILNTLITLFQKKN